MDDKDGLNSAFSNSEAMRSLTAALESFKKSIESYYSKTLNLTEGLESAVHRIDLSASVVPAVNKITAMDLTPLLDKAIDFEQIRKSMAQASKSFAVLQLQVSDSAKAIQESVASAAWKRMVVSLDAARPYMTEEQADAVDAIVEPAISETVLTPKRLTFSQWLTLFGVIMQLITLVVSRLPDEQLEEISRQNEVIIEQQAEQTELLHRLTDTAAEICEILDTFQQDSEQPEDLTDLPGLPGCDVAEAPDDDGEPEHLDAEDDNSDDLDQQDDHDR